jgi:hypothetical protein
MKFEIEIRTGYKDYRMTVEQINVTKVSEQFKISNISGTNYIGIQTNRPFFRNKGLKKRKPNFELIEGKITYNKYVKDAFIKIMQEIEPENYPKPKPIIYEDVVIKPKKREIKESSTSLGENIAKGKEKGKE